MSKNTHEYWAGVLRYWINHAKELDYDSNKQENEEIVRCELVDETCNGCPHSVPHVRIPSCIVNCGVCETQKEQEFK